MAIRFKPLLPGTTLGITFGIRRDSSAANRRVRGWLNRVGIAVLSCATESPVSSRGSASAPVRARTRRTSLFRRARACSSTRRATYGRSARPARRYAASPDDSGVTWETARRARPVFGLHATRPVAAGVSNIAWRRPLPPGTNRAEVSAMSLFAVGVVPAQAPNECSRDARGATSDHEFEPPGLFRF